MDFLQHMHNERHLIVDLLLQEHETRYNAEYIETRDRSTTTFSIESIARDRTCSFTGHRPEMLKRSYEECLRSLTKAIVDSYDDGFRIFKGIFDQHTSRSKHPDRVVAPIKGTSISSFDTRGGNYIAKYMQAAVKVMQRIMKETMVDININDFLVYK